MNEHMSPIPSRLYNAAVNGHVAGADQIIDDKTGLTLDKVASGALEEKEYTSGSNNGMGRVVLRRNIVNGINTLTQNMINKNNTIYVIQYDFTIGEDITIPDNCIMEFDGGSVSGEHTITGVNTGIKASLIKIFNTDVTLVGTWNVAEAYPEWFGASENNIDNKIELQKCMDSPFNTILLSALYDISGTLYINKNIYLKGSDIVYVYANSNAKYIGIHVTNRVNCFEFNKNVNFSAENILIRGFVDDYIYSTIPDYNYSGIYSYYKGMIKEIKGCTIQGFTYGIYSEGAYIRFILNSTFSACRFGLYTRYTSDYYVIGCGFNTCALSVNQSVTDTNIDTVHTVGAGAVIHGGSMIKFIGNRFEWNYINFLIRESAFQLLVSDNIFDAATVSHIHIFNKYEKIDISGLPYTINNVIFDSNVISKGAGTNNNKGFGIISLSNAATRKMRVQISNNNVVDMIGDIVGTERKFEHDIIYMFTQGIQNTDPIFELSNNHFNTEATNIFGLKGGSDGNILIVDTNSDFGNADRDIWHNIITFRKIEYNGGNTAKIWNSISDGSSSAKEKDKTISLQANGNDRPILNEASKGFVFFDTSLSPARPIWWNGTAWVDSTGATV